MTLAGELAGAFLAGVGFTLVGLAIAVPRLGPRLIRWQMQRTLKSADLAGMAKRLGSQSVEGDAAIDEAVARKP